MGGKKRTMVLGMVLILAAAGASCQMNYRMGYIVTLKGDTIAGLVRDYGYNTSSRLCTFKSEKNAEVRKYGPGQILGYGIDGYKRFTSMEWVSTKGYADIFAEVILEGDLSLYHYWKTKDLAYSIRRNNGDLAQLQIVEFSLRRKSDMGQYTYGDKVEGVIPVYRDTLRSIFRDDRQICDQVDRVDYRVKPIVKVTKAYLEKHCEKEPCLGYEKNFRLTRDRFGIFGGVQVSQFVHAYSLVESDPVLSYPVGLFYQVPLSYFSDRLNLQFELLYRYLYYAPLYNLQPVPAYNYASAHITGIPILLNYRLSVKRFSPVIGMGKELGFVLASDVEFQYVNDLGETTFDYYKIHQVNKGGWFIDVGADFELSQGLSLFAKVRVQRYKNKIIYDDVISNSGFDAADGEQIRTDAVALYMGIRF